ncbi:MAG TPA: hypothetical protein VH083_11740 [Myxococcales bacterium]|jgi:hypothetical protein|nr:hypothetical protein [Myxococcales bacterium]
MSLNEYLKGLAEHLVAELQPTVSVKQLTANSALLGTYAEAAIRRLIKRVVSPMHVSTGAVLDYPTPDVLAPSWGDRPSLDEFAIYLDGRRSEILSRNSNRDRLRVDDGRCFAVVKYSRQHFTQTERHLQKAEWQPGLPSGKGAFEYRRKQPRYGNDQIVLAVLVH